MGIGALLVLIFAVRRQRRQPSTPSPPGIDFVHKTVTDKLAEQERRSIALDAKAGVLLGATAAAFGLVVINSNNAAGLFGHYAVLTFLAVVILAIVFFLLLKSVLVRSFLDVPDPGTLITLANRTESEIKVLTLEAMQGTYSSNSEQYEEKAELLLRAQQLLGWFVGLVVFFQVIAVVPDATRMWVCQYLLVPIVVVMQAWIQRVSEILTGG